MKKVVALLVLALICHQFGHAMAPKEENYYELLGVSKDASDAEIRKAFRKKALQYHPDKNKDDNAEEMFKKINNAYEILSDAKTRQQYDAGKPVQPDMPKQEGEKPFSWDDFFAHKFYPTDAAGIKKLYNELLSQADKLFFGDKLRWGHLDDFCNDDELVDLKQDPEIKQMCDMLPIITKINQLTKLSIPEKKKIDQDAKVKKYYTDTQTAHVDSVNRKLKEKDIAEEEYKYSGTFPYEHMIRQLTPFTPATSAKILNIYSEVIEKFTQKKDFRNAQKVADIAGDKKASLKYEITSMGQDLPPKFQQALTTLDHAIAEIEPAKQRANQEKAERVAKEKAKELEDKAKAAQKEKLNDLKKRLDEIKTDLSKSDDSKAQWALALTDNLISIHAQDSQSYQIAKEALGLVQNWIKRNENNTDIKKQALVSVFKNAEKKMTKELLERRWELFKKSIYVE